MGAREQAACVAEHEQGQFVFAVFELHGLVAQPQRTLFGVEPVGAEHQVVAHGLRVRAAQQGGGAGHQFTHAQGLGHEVVGAAGQGFDHVLLFAAAGDEQDGQVPPCCLAHGGDHLGAFHVGQVPVHDEQIEGLVPDVLQQLGAGQVGVADVAMLLGGGFDQLQQDRIVVEGGYSHGVVTALGRTLEGSKKTF